ncbi:MAG: tetratricopeptide repeat protein [Bacteroidetes bacterium]|nr:tetratricopeptide repeat protein [Bacteroidota bacterium]
MAKKNSEAQEGNVQIEETYNKVEVFFEENQNLVMGVLGTIILVVAAIVLYGRFVLAPKEAEAKKEIFKAQQWFEADSFQLALEGDGNYYGFYNIIDDFKSTKAGKTARYYAGICNLQLGNYNEAIDQLSKFKTSDVNVQAVALGGIGDAYAQLEDMDMAVDYYDKAATKSNIGSIAPTYYIRAGKAYELLDNLSSAEKMYRAVVEKYPESTSFSTAERNLARLTTTAN